MADTYDEVIKKYEKQIQKYKDKIAKAKTQQRKADTHEKIEVGAILESVLGRKFQDKAQRENLLNALQEKHDGYSIADILNESIAKLEKKEENPESDSVSEDALNEIPDSELNPYNEQYRSNANASDTQQQSFDFNSKY